MLHTIGTDKTAHKDHPGSARYQKHFREVDAALGEFLQTLDLERDSLIIAGDHGHQELGHHTHESVAIFAGADFRSMFDQLGEVDGVAQTDLLYFMSYPLLLPLPTSYEGDIYSSANPTGKFARFLEVQRRHLSAEAGLPADLDAKEAMAKVRQKHQDERFDPALKYAPILLLFFLFVAQALAALGRGPTATDTRVLLALVVASVPVALLTSPDRGLWLALPILLAGAYLAWRRVGLRAHLFLGLVTAAATFTAMNAGDWADFFHTTGGFKPAIVLFYALLFGGGALLATILFDRLPNTLYRLPYGAMAFAFFVLPSGLYYYQAAQNILFGFFVGALPLGIWWLISRRKEGTFLPAEFKPSDWLPTVIVAAGALFLLMQEAGGWNWHLHAVTWMQRLGSVASFVILGLMLTYWIWAAESALKRAAVLLFGVASIFGCTVFGELPVETLAGSLIPAVFLTGYLQLDRRLRADDRLTDGADAHALAVRRGLLVAALTIISLWIATSGFLLQNVDFSFALDWFSEYFALERDVFLFTFLATLVKYGLPPAGVLLALATLARRQDFRPIAIAAFGFLMVEIYVLFVQIFAGSTSGAQKYHELTISALLFVYSLAGVFVASYLVLRAAQALGRRIRGEG